MTTEAPAVQLGVIGALVLSVASSVAIVVCNKALISTLDFPFATTLTSWHLMVTFCTLHVAQRLRMFEPKSIDFRTVFLFGLLNGTSIGLLNLSLGFNSIGFYQVRSLLRSFLQFTSSTASQMTKLAIIPFTAFIVLSCLIAVSVNFSTFLVIGTTSAVTYQVLGHLKTCLILAFGYILLHDPFTSRNMIGILIAVFGMGLYSYHRVQEGKKKVAEDRLPLSQESRPLLGVKSMSHHVDNENTDTKKANGSANKSYLA
ncbi:hypothetical protein Taro_028316 [Colocasia esculenta]|uniref:Sugar phosphate transporter domain-containing protein n=1 Tax=Colocasia esculenta TaxID=4460 RepID=A0A843VQ22_COLES|nr:hypothetical protein [Colocasia esculenta]